MRARRLAGGLVLVVAAVALALAYLVRQAPRLLEARLERELGREVTMEGARWVWPAGLDVARLTIAGTDAAGVASGTPDDIVLIAQPVTVRLRPSALVGRTVDVASLIVGTVQATVWIRDGALTHALSRPGQDVGSAATGIGRLGHLRIEQGTVRFIDHDVASDPFAAEFGAVKAEIATDVEGVTWYRAAAELSQGATYAPARVVLTGTHDGRSGAGDAGLQIDAIAVPHFGAYLRQMTATRVEQGLLALRSRTQVSGRMWTTSAHAEVTGLSIGADGPGGAAPLGLEPSAVIDLFRNPSGAAALDVTFTWNRDDPSTTFRQALSDGIRDSVQAKVAASLPQILGRLVNQGRGERPGAAPWKALLKGFLSGVNPRP